MGPATHGKPRRRQRNAKAAADGFDACTAEWRRPCGWLAHGAIQAMCGVGLLCRSGRWRHLAGTRGHKSTEPPMHGYRLSVSFVTMRPLALRGGPLVLCLPAIEIINFAGNRASHASLGRARHMTPPIEARSAARCDRVGLPLLPPCNAAPVRTICAARLPNYRVSAVCAARADGKAWWALRGPKLRKCTSSFRMHFIVTSILRLTCASLLI